MCNPLELTRYQARRMPGEQSGRGGVVSKRNIDKQCHEMTSRRLGTGTRPAGERGTLIP